MGVALTESEVRRFEKLRQYFLKKAPTKEECALHYRAKYPPASLVKLALDKFGCGTRSLYDGFGIVKLRWSLERRLMEADFDYEKVFSRLEEGSPDLEMLLNNALFSTAYLNRDNFVDNLVPKLEGKGKINIWNPGCSYGTETYSLAFGLYEAGIDARILASDINPDVFDEVSTGRYKVVDKNHEKFFQEAYGDKLGRFVKKCGKEFVVRKPIRNMVDFLPFNLKTDLLDNPNPESEVFLRAPYNAIVCRHTLVYLQRRLASEVLRKFYGLMKDSGMLCVGAADNLEPEFVARQGLFKQLCAYLFTKAA